MSGNASRVIVEPNCETVWPVHSFIKSEWRQGPEKRSAKVKLHVVEIMVLVER